MKLISVDEMKEIQLQILKHFIDYCNKNSLDYFLCGGTLIGAVRHKGFIPWDDDIDVMMPRESYDRFLKDYKKSEFELFDCWSRNDYYYPFAKLADPKTQLKEKTNVETNFGVYIDIFPVDILPSGNLACKTMYIKRTILDLKMTSKTAINKPRSFPKQLILNILRGVYKKENIVGIVRQIDTLSKRYKGRLTSHTGRVAWGYGMREIMPSEVYKDYELCQFQNLMCRIPKGYDRLLKSMYGDYMRLPPKEEQINRHDVEIYKL